MKLIKDYEVEGCWSSRKDGRCRTCGSLLKLVPKEGHYNSQYWELKQDDGCELVCCPKGCAEEDGTNAFRKFWEVRLYCTAKSESWKWEYDYNKICDAWVDRKGNVFPLGTREHIQFAYDRDTTEQDMEKQGWLKVSGRHFMWCRKLSAKQVDVIFDYLNGVFDDKAVIEFGKEMDYPTGYFKSEYK